MKPQPSPLTHRKKGGEHMSGYDGALARSEGERGSKGIELSSPMPAKGPVQFSSTTDESTMDVGPIAQTFSEATTRNLANTRSTYGRSLRVRWDLSLKAKKKGGGEQIILHRIGELFFGGNMSRELSIVFGHILPLELWAEKSVFGRMVKIVVLIIPF